MTVELWRWAGGSETLGRGESWEREVKVVRVES